MSLISISLNKYKGFEISAGQVPVIRIVFRSIIVHSFWFERNKLLTVGPFITYPAWSD